MPGVGQTGEITVGYMGTFGGVDVFIVFIAVIVSWVYANIKLIKCTVYCMLELFLKKDTCMRNYVSKGIPPIEASLEEVIEAVTGTGWPSTAHD